MSCPDKPISPEGLLEGQPLQRPNLQNEAGWIMHGINQLNARIGELNGKIDRLDERLRTLENKFSKAAGWAAAAFALVFLLQLALRFIKISVDFGS